MANLGLMFGLCLIFDLCLIYWVLIRKNVELERREEKRLFTFFGCLYYFNGMILLFNVVNVKIEYVMNEML